MKKKFLQKHWFQPSKQLESSNMYCVNNFILASHVALVNNKFIVSSFNAIVKYHYKGIFRTIILLKYIVTIMLFTCIIYNTREILSNDANDFWKSSFNNVFSSHICQKNKSTEHLKKNVLWFVAKIHTYIT